MQGPLNKSSVVALRRSPTQYFVASDYPTAASYQSSGASNQYITTAINQYKALVTQTAGLTISSSHR